MILREQRSGQRLVSDVPFLSSLGRADRRHHIPIVGVVLKIRTQRIQLLTARTVSGNIVFKSRFLRIQVLVHVLLQSALNICIGENLLQLRHDRRRSVLFSLEIHSGIRDEQSL